MPTDNSNPPKALIIPDADQVRQDAELFGVTKQYIDWVEAVATGQQKGTQEDVSNALVIARGNIATLEHNHFIAQAAVAGLQEAVSKLIDQRDEALADGEQQWQDGYDQGMAETEEYFFSGNYEVDSETTWDVLKTEQERRVDMLLEGLGVLGEAEKGKELQAQFDLMTKHYETAADLIDQIDHALWERRNEIAKLKGHAVDDPDDEEDDDGMPDEDEDEFEDGDDDVMEDDPNADAFI